MIVSLLPNTQKKMDDERIIQLRKSNNELLKIIRNLSKQNREKEKELRVVKWKLERIKQAYINFERTETDYNNMLWILDDVIMNR